MMKLLLSSTILTLLFGVIQADIERGLTSHFSTWLKNNGYEKHGFERTDLVGGSYGGKESDDDSVTHHPIVFFHGNSDVAVGTVDDFTGFTKSIEHFISKGYKKSELYITTWGPGQSSKAADQTHSKEYLEYLRAFTEAVIAYTGAEKIDVISHSMGVTLGRRVIKGGKVNAAANPFNLGPSLADKVDTFIGIAGANWGLTTCFSFPTLATCSSTNGFYPGYAIGPMGLSSYLKELNDDSIKEGDHTFAIFSVIDDLIGFGDMVWGQYTSKWPTVDDSKIFNFEITCHMKLRDETAPVQYDLIKNHKFTDETTINSTVFLQ